MARKVYSDEDIVELLREIELHLTGGADVSLACCVAVRSFRTTSGRLIWVMIS